MDAIRVEEVSKCYRLGGGVLGADTMRDALAGVFRRLRPRRGLPGGAASPHEHWALREVSFSVRRGERLGIIGLNGAGKSTLLKLISRITPPSSGRIRLRGRVASLLEVGTGFHGELSGRENVFLNGAVLGMSRREIREKFHEIVEFAGVERFLDTPVKRYSSGMYMRLAFAVAAHLEPDILLVDEVLAVGDAAFQKKCLGKMEQVSQGEGRTILFVSHNMSALRALCSRALVLEQGRLIMDGDAGEAVERYLGMVAGGQLEVRWSREEAPTNGGIALRAARLLPGEGALAVTTDTPFDIELEYDVIAPDTCAGLTVLLRDATGGLVLSSINNREPTWYGRVSPPGTYLARCSFPGQLLNDGAFSVSLLLFGRGFGDAKTVEDVLRFEVQDTETLRGDFHGALGGVVRPDLTWVTERLDSN